MQAAWLKKIRIGLVLLGLAFMLLVMLGRLSLLQIFSFDGGVNFLKAQGEARSVRSEVVKADRGMIVDRYGRPLAVSTPLETIWANPQEIFQWQADISQLEKLSAEQKTAILAEQKTKLQQLAILLGKTGQDLNQRLQRYKDKQFIYLERKITPDIAEQIEALDIQGIYSEQESRRFYPAGEITAQLVGFTNIENKGQEGLEYAYDRYLEGHDGKNIVVKDRQGHIIKTVKTVKEAQAGKNLVLSIDLRLQHVAYRALKKAVIANRADAGTVVILDVHTGEVLAMANQPSFNPNDRSSIKPQSVRNRAMIDVFEPGSTAKPLTMVAALESGKYTPETPVNASPGHIRLNGHTILDPVNYGMLDVTRVLVKSSQIGTSRIALSLDPERVYGVFSRLGFGKYSGAGFPGEQIGYLPNRYKWSDIERATFAFGYGFNITAVQLARAYTTFANGGMEYPVSLLKLDKPAQGIRVIDKKIADEILQMLVQVTGKHGTAHAARIPLYQVAGKTGTAHKVGAQGYQAGHYRAFFAGITPAKDPRLAVVIMVDNPKGDEYYGGEVSAPVFAEIAAGSMRILNITPDQLPEDQIAKVGGRDAKTAF